MRRLLLSALILPLFAAPFACSATGHGQSTSTSGGGGSGGEGGHGGAGGGGACDTCLGDSYTPCNADGSPGAPVKCPAACAVGKGCVECVPGELLCVGNEVHKCADDGKGPGALVQTCDVNAGMTCNDGMCADACKLAADQPSNVGCVFWAVDLDQQDALNDPASAPWGVALSNAGDGQANVTIELNEAPVGQALKTKVVQQVTVPPGSLQAIVLPTRELDCGVKPNDYASPGTCLSSNAYRITSSTPIVVYQFNAFANSFSNDASLLLPEGALGKTYRIIGWPAGHPVAIPGFNILDRSYITVVGTVPNTQVTVKPSWRIKGNPPIAATMAGGQIVATIGPFDVLNLETDDGTFQDDPKTIADLSGSLVQASAPVAVYSGVESTGAPGGVVTVPTPPGWTDMDTCCLDHLEDQIFPIESVGTHYVLTRSPIRSTGSFHEPDVVRFVGVAEDADVTTSLPPPFDAFTIKPGQVLTTWTQDDIVVSATKPVMVGQILVSNEYVDGPYIGDPSLTVYPPVEQYRTEYVILTPSSWTQSWIVIAAETGADVTLDGKPTTGLCLLNDAGSLLGVSYQSRRCQVQDGVHKLSGKKPFGIVAYGYGAAGSYAVAGGADVKHVYDPPPIK
jgi:IgGFc binding protein